MPRYCATKSMVAVDSQPFSSCAMVNAAITADCFWSAGYLSTARSILASEAGLNARGAFICRSSVNLTEHDVLRTDDRDDVGNHVPAHHFVESRQVRIAGRADLHAIRLVG